jgi:hypothetical protein
MLGPRTAVGLTVATFAFAGGGAALAATHGSSHNARPTHSTRYNMAAHSQGKCPNMGPTTSSASGV